MHCKCNEIEEWGSSGKDRYVKEGKALWCEYLSYLNIPSNSLGKYEIYSNHYKCIRKKVSSRACIYCGTGNDNTVSWKLVGSLKSLHPSQYLCLVNLLPEDCALSPTDWLCSSCNVFISTESSLDLMIQ